MKKKGHETAQRTLKRKAKCILQSWRGGKHARKGSKGGKARRLFSLVERERGWENDWQGRKRESWWVAKSTEGNGKSEKKKKKKKNEPLRYKYINDSQKNMADASELGGMDRIVHEKRGGKMWRLLERGKERGGGCRRPARNGSCEAEPREKRKKGACMLLVEEKRGKKEVRTLGEGGGDCSVLETGKKRNRESGSPIGKGDRFGGWSCTGKDSRLRIIFGEEEEGEDWGGLSYAQQGERGLDCKGLGASRKTYESSRAQGGEGGAFCPNSTKGGGSGAPPVARAHLLRKKKREG